MGTLQLKLDTAEYSSLSVFGVFGVSVSDVAAQRDEVCQASPVTVLFVFLKNVQSP